MRASRYLLILAVLAFARSASPCNYCREDNRAAVYSYEAMQKVKADPDRLEFVVLKIKGKIAPETAGAIQEWLGHRTGVDGTTVKISTLQKSIGFVFDKTRGLDALVADLIGAFAPLQFETLDFSPK